MISKRVAESSTNAGVDLSNRGRISEGVVSAEVINNAKAREAERIEGLKTSRILASHNGPRDPKEAQQPIYDKKQIAAQSRKLPDERFITVSERTVKGILRETLSKKEADRLYGLLRDADKMALENAKKHNERTE